MKQTGGIVSALTIAGSDSGGGAGIQADLKAFAALGVHGTSVVTCITAQNPRRIVRIQPCSAALVRFQLEAVFDTFYPAAIKIGMLYSPAIVKAVSRFLRRHPATLVVDPVMISTSGTRLLLPAARPLFLRELAPRAALLMPNIPETEVLLRRKVRSVQDMRSAAREINRRFGCAALVKGGHLAGNKEAVDIFNNGTQELLLSAPFIPNVRTHGTGCTYSAAVTAGLARGEGMVRAVELAKKYVSVAIAGTRKVGMSEVLG